MAKAENRKAKGNHMSAVNPRAASVSRTKVQGTMRGFIFGRWRWHLVCSFARRLRSGLID